MCFTILTVFDKKYHFQQKTCFFDTKNTARFISHATPFDFMLSFSMSSLKNQNRLRLMLVGLYFVNFPDSKIRYFSDEIDHIFTECPNSSRLQIS